MSPHGHSLQLRHAAAALIWPGLIVILVYVTLPASPDQDSGPLLWPSFSEEVIQAGRHSVITSSARSEAIIRAQETRPTASVHAIPPTREAILSEIETYLNPRAGAEHEAARGAIEQLASKAVEPLIAIMNDDQVKQAQRETAASLLLRLGQTARGETRLTPIELRPLSEQAGTIVDGLALFLQTHPDCDLGVGYLTEVTPIDHVARIVELIQASSGMQQAEFINVFGALTHTSFPTIPREFCGNSSSESIRQAQEQGAIVQQESVKAIRAWWNTHGQEPYSSWASAGLRRHLDQENKSRTSMVTMSEPRLRDFHIREGGGSQRFGPSVYDLLRTEYHSATAIMRPYILRLIAPTGHPDAARFVVAQLSDSDPNVRYVALESLDVCGGAESIPAIRQALDPAGPSDLYKLGLEKLVKFGGAEAISDLAAALKHRDEETREAAMNALPPLLSQRPDWLARISASDPVVGQSLRERVQIKQFVKATEATATSPAQGASDLNTVRQFLKATDTSTQIQAIRLVSERELVELIPEVLLLLRSQDSKVRDATEEAVLQLGVPIPDLKQVQRGLGYSVRLDRDLARLCYGRYGRDALPLVRKVAVGWQDKPWNGRGGIATPAFELFEILLKERFPGVERDILNLVASVKDPSYIDLLKLLDTPRSASLVEELLSEEGFRQQQAIEVARARKLTNLADALYRISLLEPDPQVLASIDADYRSGKLTYLDRHLRQLAQFQRPSNALHATFALIDLGDSRAWQAGVRCLARPDLDTQYGPFRPSGSLAIQMGTALHQLRQPDQARRLLEQELTGTNRPHIVLAMTAALIVQPRSEDADLLYRVASSPQVEPRARILAAVALSRLHDTQAVPILQELLRPVIQPSGDHRAQTSFLWLARGCPPVFDLPRRPSRHPPWLPTTVLTRPSLSRDQVDVGAALRRLGDRSMIDQVLPALVDDRGFLHEEVYDALVGLVGQEAYQRAKQRLANAEPNTVAQLSQMALLYSDGITRTEALALLAQAPGLGTSELGAIRRLRLREAGDQLVTEYSRLDDLYKGQSGLEILKVLCELGDSRGIGLAARDPLLLMQMADYLPEGIMSDMPSSQMKYNRIEEGLRLQEWYSRNRDHLRWDSTTGRFVVEQGDSILPSRGPTWLDASFTSLSG